MPAVTYKFEDHVKVHDSKYIFQSVENRRLSNIYHLHEFYEVILLIKGMVTHKINGRDCEMLKGDCVILTPKDKHSFTAQSDDVKLIGLSVSSEEFLPFSNAFGVNFRTSGEPKMFSCLNRLNDLEAQATRCCNVTDDNENKLLLSMLLNVYKAVPMTDELNIPVALSNAVCQMESADNLKQGVDGLVRLSNYSYPHLYRLMKKYYGLTPHEFVLRLKLDTAYSLLIQSDNSVEDVAEGVGFMSVNHFNKVFSEKFGITPASLRKQYTSAYF